MRNLRRHSNTKIKKSAQIRIDSRCYWSLEIATPGFAGFAKTTANISLRHAWAIKIPWRRCSGFDTLRCAEGRCSAVAKEAGAQVSTPYAALRAGAQPSLFPQVKKHQAAGERPDQW